MRTSAAAVAVAALLAAVALIATPAWAGPTRDAWRRGSRRARRPHRRRRPYRHPGRQHSGPHFLSLPGNASYVAGFFSSAFNEYLDRSVMTIDAFDWVHRTGAKLRSLAFRGDRTLPALPIAWTVSDGVLFSGSESNAEASAVTSVTVPAADPTLSFQASYGEEEGYDYGYVIVSTDGGATYTAVAGDRTMAGSRGPAVNGTTDGFERHTYDLSAYAGRTVLLGFQYISDSNTDLGGGVSMIFVKRQRRGLWGFRRWAVGRASCRGASRR